jgi:hypothetical protein
MHDFHKVREMKGGVNNIWRLVHKGNEICGHDQKIEDNKVRLQHHVANLNTNHITIRVKVLVGILKASHIICPTVKCLAHD